ncbi:MAG: competence/damage-inducible protein A [Rickettsiales bacterium]
MQPTACLIIIGNEILSGRTQDKNVSWLAQKLNEQGIKLAHVRIIPDVEQIIIETVNACRPAYDHVFTTGGIGPTHDDITAASVARAFGVKLLRHPEAERRLLAHYRPEQINEARMKMADIPEGATLIDNPVSTAPGFQLGNVFVLAGVPNIMQAMFDSLKSNLKSGEKTLSRTLKTNLAEGTLAKDLSDIQSRYPDVEIGSYPHFQMGQLSTSLVFRSTSAEKLDASLSETRIALVALGGEAEELYS